MVTVVVVVPESVDVPEEEFEQTRPRRDRRLYCFNCHRDENFFGSFRGHWLHAFWTGMTLGLNAFLGPYTCRCCGHRRLFWPDWLNPRRWF